MSRLSPAFFAPILFAFAALLALPNLASAADAKKGETYFKSNCTACHDTEPGKNKVGPSLAGVYGRQAGSYESFKLYRGLKGASWTWDDTTLDGYLSDPVRYAKEKNGKNAAMVFKVTNADTRADVIAYLKTLKADK